MPIVPGIACINTSIPFTPQVKGVELTFKDGQRALGQIVKETPDGIIFNMDGAEVNFTNDEIVSRAEVAIPSAGASKQGNKQRMSFITFDSSISIFNQIAGKGPEKKTAVPPASLWGAKPRSAVPRSSGVKAPSGSIMGEYQKAMSPESLEKWKNDSIEQMNVGRNPFVEAAHAAQAKASSADTSRSEAKLKELEEKGF